MNDSTLTKSRQPAPPAITIEERTRLAQAVSRCLHLPAIEFERLGRRDSFAIQHRPKMLEDRALAMQRLIRVGERLAEAGHDIEQVACAIESVSLHTSDLLAGISCKRPAIKISREAITERLAEIFRGLREILRVNENACTVGGKARQHE